MPFATLAHRINISSIRRGAFVFTLALSAAFSSACAENDVAHAKEIGESAAFQRARGYYTLQEYKDAAEAFAAFNAAFPKSERLEESKLFLAESHYQLRNFAEAAKAFDAFVADYPKSPRRGDALLRAARSFSNVKDYRNCLKHAQTYIEENRDKEKDAPAQDPLHHKFATALYDAGDCSFELKDYPKAQAYWEELVSKKAQSNLVIEGNYGLGWVYFNAKDYEKAAAAFHAVAGQENAHAAWSKLMEGRALAALKKTPEALAAIREASKLAGADAKLSAECIVRETELLLESNDVAELLTSLKKLAKDFAALPATPLTLERAVSKLYDAQKHAEALEASDLYLSLTAANAASHSNRAPIARMKARSLIALKRGADALTAAKDAITEAAALADAKLKEEEQPAAMMLLAELMAKDALPTYKELVAKFPNSRFAAAAQYEMARLAGESGHLDEALAFAEALVEKLQAAPANPQAAQLKRDALFAAGEFAFHKPDHKKSVQYARAYQKEYGDKDARADDVARKLAWSLHETGDDAGAVTVLEPALQAFANSTHRDEMLYLRALTATKLGDAAAALKFNEQLTREVPASPFADDALFDAAVLQFKQKQYEQALAKLSQLLEKPSPKAELKNIALQLRASARLQLKQFSGAQTDADELLNKGAADPKLNLPAIRLIKAMALLSQPGKETDALAAFNDLIAKGPTDSPEVRQGQARRAYLLFAAKKYAEAKTDFEALSDPAKSASPQDATDAALHLAVIHRELKETPQAKALLEKLAGQKLEGIAAFEAPSQLGNILFEAKEYVPAIQAYERALAAAAGQKDVALSQLSAARLNLAWALEKNNEKDKAEKAFANVVKEDAKGPYAAEALFERARLLSELGKNTGALPLWKEILEHFPDVVYGKTTYAEQAIFLQGQAQAKAGNFKEAAESFETHATKFPNANLREAFCGVGESRLRLNEMDKAREAFEKVLGPKGIEAELDDQTERALLGLAEVAMKAGDGTRAKKLALRILTEKQQSEWADAAYFVAGQASEVLKEPERAIGYYRRLLSERPKSIHVPAAEERLRALGAPK